MASKETRPEQQFKLGENIRYIESRKYGKSFQCLKVTFLCVSDNMMDSRTTMPSIVKVTHGLWYCNCCAVECD